MRTAHTLRYLLLRHLQALEGRASREAIALVAKTLSVTVEGDRYVVTWRSDGELRTRWFARDRFVFYDRGDTRAASRTVEEDLATENDAIAQEFACEVLAVTGAAPERPRAAREPYAWFRAALESLVAASIATFGGMPALGVALLALLWVERLRGGRLYASGLFVGLATFAPPLAAALGAASYGLLQLLDPSRVHRIARAGLCAVAVLIGLGRLVGTGIAAASWLGLELMVVSLLALVLSTLRSLYDSHFRAMPLALPFLCVGLHASGHVTAAFIGLCGVGIDLLGTVWLHRLWPVQQERRLTPNG